MNMKQKTLYIAGMHCRACSVRIEDSLLAVDGIDSVKVSHRHGTAIVSYEGQRDTDRVVSAITSAGYALVDAPEQSSWFSRDTSVWTYFALSLLTLFVFYVLLRDVSFMDMAVQYSGFGGMLVLGLLAGVSTCMAVVGGVLLTVSSRWSQAWDSSWHKREPQLWFHLGRIVGFTLLGGLLWLIGSQLQIWWWGYVIIFLLVGYIMLMQGLRLTEISPKLSSYDIWYPVWLHRVFSSIFGNKTKQAEASSLWFATFFLPCGFTLVAQALAISSGNFWSAALIMLGFALWTLPWLLGLWWLTLLWKWSIRKSLFRFLWVVLMVFAVYNFMWASNTFGGIRSAVVNTSSVVYPITQEKDIYISQDARGYHPNTIRVKVGTKINLHIDSQNQYSCASTISIPAAWVQAILLPWDNVFEVIADRVGKIPFGCTMGMMYRGEIIVEE